MTVSFTKNEIGWLFNFISVATQDLDEEDEFHKEILDAAKKIEEKLIAQIKR